MVSSSGGRYVCRDAGDAHDTQETILQYPDFTLTWMMSQINAYRFDIKGRVGIYFYGTDENGKESRPLQYLGITHRLRTTTLAERLAHRHTTDG